MFSPNTLQSRFVLGFSHKNSRRVVFVIGTRADPIASYRIDIEDTTRFVRIEDAVPL